ncbi:MAG: plastocyanin/azurin family copper-binding protein [Bacteroidia bacterium]|jgi:azurin|nr:plastocyanin/azurin family copper-binding protein [Bacteroidia bacterium]
MTNYITISILALSLIACSGGQKDGFSSADSQELSTTPVKATIPVDQSDTIYIIATGANMSEMRFDAKRIKVPAEKKITVALENKSTDATMPHNIAFIQEGTANEVGQGGLKFKENGYVNPSDENVIANSPVVQIGQIKYFTFITPTAGNYEFICSYPGHWGMMKGKFVTE